MRAQLKSVTSPDAVSLARYRPADPADTKLFVELTVGPADDVGEETFGLTIATPSWLGRETQRRGPLIGRHYLIVNHWNWPDIRRYLSRQVDSIEAETWKEVAERVARIAYWEFEDYRDTPDR